MEDEVEANDGKEAAVDDKAKKADDESKQIMVPKTRLDEEIAKKERLAAEVQELADEKATAQEAALAEQGEFKELYEAQKEAVAEAEKQLAELKLETVKRHVAQEAGLPDFWTRLNGETAEDIAADMQALVALIPKAKAPNIDAGTTSGKRAGEQDRTVKKTDAQKAELAGILGVQAKYID